MVDIGIDDANVGAIHVLNVVKGDIAARAVVAGDLVGFQGVVAVGVGQTQLDVLPLEIGGVNTDGFDAGEARLSKEIVGALDGYHQGVIAARTVDLVAGLQGVLGGLEGVCLGSTGQVILTGFEVVFFANRVVVFSDS